MKFNQAEKLAIVKAIDSVILADGKIHAGEINVMTQLMHILKFDSNFIADARNIDGNEGLAILRAMPTDKKKGLAVILEEVANSDGFVHEKEMDVILGIFSSIGIGQEHE